jgi:hypothetical protein
VRIEFSRSLFTILQNKPSEIDVSIKIITTKKKGGGSGVVRRKALSKKTLHLTLLHAKHHPKPKEK